MIRSRSSAAARFVNVTARIRHGGDALDADQVGDPVGQDAGLAGAGTGQDEERTLGRRDGAGLLRVERLDDLFRTFGAAALDDRGVGWRGGRSGRVLTRERGVAQPFGLGRARRCVGFRGVGEAGAGDGRGLVERGLSAALPGGGTHLRILGGGAHRSLRGGRQFPGATWSGGGALIDTASSHFEKRQVQHALHHWRPGRHRPSCRRVGSCPW